MMASPAYMTTNPKRYSPTLKSHVDACRLIDDFSEVIGCQDGEGAVIIAKTSDEVDFAEYLADLTVNLTSLPPAAGATLCASWSETGCGLPD